MRVLLVEDDATTAKSVELMLAAKGYDCETTAYGEDALRMVRERDYDLVLLDIMLPDIDGYEVLKRMQAADVRIPVLVQSGLVSDEADQPTLGVVDSLVKPFGPKELDKSIKAATQRAEAEAEAEAETTAPEAEADPAEKRGGPRTRIMKGGKIVFKEANCNMDCLVISLSDGGAALQPEDMLNVPDNFRLEISYGPTHDCEVCWRHGNKIGVKFLKF